MDKYMTPATREDESIAQAHRELCGLTDPAALAEDADGRVQGASTQAEREHWQCMAAYWWNLAEWPEPFAGYDANTRAGLPPDGDTGE